MSNIDDPEWADNPRLNGWLHTQAALFSGWVEQTEGRWDFSTGSLDRLEQEIKRRYPSYDDAQAARDDAFMTVSAWYVGEVHVRNYGAVWRCAPQPGLGVHARTEPVVRLPKEVLEHWELAELQEKEELYEDDFPYCNPSEAVVSAARPEYTGHLSSFLHQYAPWQTAVDRALTRARNQPSQSPKGHPLPDAPGPLDPGPLGESLAEWLAVQEEVFPRWAEATGRPADFDFTPASLGALEEVLREALAPQAGTGTLYDDPVFNCAVWYLGETICRNHQARWLPMRANLDVTGDRLDLLAVAHIARRIGPRTELTSAIHRSIRGVHYPDDSYQPLRAVLDAYR
ncbi:hypothetical protein ABZU53_27995 [Micromonospora sp. NPDC005194]|uniref:hypothetical protein n=1 Tax=Micromonospora sp. NPDC005194 TaxID=3156870 RepID=UPI0033B637E7